MKKLFLLYFILITLGVSAQDTLSFNGITAEITQHQLSMSMMHKLPNVKRIFLKAKKDNLEKTTEFSIIENKLYVASITVGDASIPASPLFGRDAQYPVFCSWFTGKIHVSVDDNFKLQVEDNNLVFNKNNFLINVENGVVKSISQAVYMGRLDKYRSIEDLQRVGIFSLKEKENKDWIDARIVNKPTLGNYKEWSTILDVRPFKTRGILSIDNSKRLFLYIPRTFFTEEIHISLINKVPHDISDFKSGDFVEVELSYAGRNRFYLYYMRNLSDSESIHRDNFFLNTLWNPTLAK